MSNEAGQLLAEAAQAIYGTEEWLAPFSRDLDVNPRTFRNWISGKSQPHPDVLARARGLLIKHRDALDEAAGAITAFLETMK